MKTLILMLCVAIGFVLITDPRREVLPAQAEVTTESKKPVDLLLVDALNGMNEVLEGVVGKLETIDERQAAYSKEIASIEECVADDLIEIRNRLVSVENTQAEPPKPEVKSDGSCDCGCECGDKKHEERIAALEAKIGMYPVVSSSTGYGSTGTPLASAGSAGTPVVAYKSTLGPVRAVTRTVTAPIARAGHWTYPGEIGSHLAGSHGVSTAGMSREQMLDLHDSLHEGTSVRAVQYSPMSSTRVGVAVSNCPGGNCPTSSSRVSSSGNGWWLGKSLGFRR